MAKDLSATGKYLVTLGLVQVAEETPTSQTVERELVLRAQNGDLDAFEKLVVKYYRPLFSYVYRMCTDYNETEEIVQSALVKAWQGIKGFQGRSSFKTWLFRIGTNLAINRATRRKPVCEIPETLPAPESAEPQEAYRSRQREALVRAALERLPADQRSALVLCVYEDMSYEEIARSLGKTVRAVDSLLFRARQNLRKILGPARDKGIL